MEVGTDGRSDAREVLLKLLKGVGREGCCDQHEASGSRGCCLQGRHLLCKHALCAPDRSCSARHLVKNLHAGPCHAIHVV